MDTVLAEYSSQVRNKLSNKKKVNKKIWKNNGCMIYFVWRILKRLNKMAFNKMSSFPSGGGGNRSEPFWTGTIPSRTKI